MQISGGLALSIAVFLASPLSAQESVESKLRPSVVRIRNDEYSGSGMFLDSDGLILTNAHVVCSPLPYRVQAVATIGGKASEVTFTKVKLLGFHPDYDLALLQIDPAEFGSTILPVSLAAGVPHQGERVWAVGFPGDYDGGKIKVATWGEMKSSNRDFYGMPYLEMEISVYHGNSGGPLCNDQGKVLGVVTAVMPEGRALAVPIAAMRPERFGPLKDRSPNRELSAEALNLAEEKLKLEGGRPSGESIMLFETALLWDSGNASLFSRIGQLNLIGGRHSSAMAYLTRSIQMQPWPEKAEPYRSLGYALAGLRKTDEAMAIWREGLDKFPLDNAELWGEIAVSLEKDQRNLEAAFTSQVAIKTFSGQAARMNELFRRAQARLNPSDLERLRQMVGDIDNFLGRRRAAADKARREGRAFISLEAEKVIGSMTGVQHESISPALDRTGFGKHPPEKMSDAELDIRFIRVRIEVAKEHARNGSREKAIEILEDIIKTYPSHPETEAARLALKIFQRN